jgi:tryptophanyl-tRNA synthetase
MQRVLTGIQPSGIPHIGNWLGAIRPALSYQDSHEAFYFIATYHALTTSRDAKKLREQTLDVAITWLALGLDPNKTVLWRQQSVPEVCELSWILSCMASKGLLDKAHAFKDAVAKGVKNVSAGLYTYPVLMAADILAFDSNIVPVGKDQKQHVEMARDIAGSFNYHFGETFVLPEAVIQKEVASVPGLDGQKMSKSYNNTIEIFLTAKKLRKKIMAIQTDSKSMEEAKEPETCLVFDYYKLFASLEEQAEMAERYRAGNFGYGHAKQAVFEQINALLEEPRELYQDWKKRPDDVMDILDEGAQKAQKVARETLERARTNCGL